MHNKLTKGVCFLLFCLCTIMAYGQRQALNFSVKGVLADSITNEKEAYATVRVSFIKMPDKLIKAAITDEQGNFEIKLNYPGKYQFTLSSIGKQTIIKELTLTPKQTNYNLGIIYTAEAAEILKGVEVIAQKPLVKAEIDKIAYSVEDDPDSKTNTTLEMLRKIPMVTVDGEDNIKVNGSESFKVHVNGKPNTLMSNNPKEVLRSIPANTIKSIEVITEPGARYDAEGIGGILNIITVGTKMDGYNVTLGTNVSNKGIGANGYGTVQLGKLTVAGNYSYTYFDNPKGYNESGREDFTSNKYHFLNTDGWSKSKGNYQFGNLEASYEIDSLNLITLSGNLYGGVFKNNGNSFTQMKSKALEDAYSYQTLKNAENKRHNLNVNLDYQHSFRKPGEYLTISYKYNYSPNGSETRTEYEDLNFVPYDLNNQYFDNDAHTSEHTGQVDYVNPINRYHYIDAGMKYILRTNESDSKFFLLQPDGNMKQNLDQSNNFDQDQNILAAYADYQLKWKKLGFKAGVRYEHTFMDVKYKLTPDRNFDADFNDVVPSVNLAYMFSPTSSLRANYNMRINRPSIWYLNPFRDTSNPTLVKYGNPDLDTEKAHLVGLTYSTFSAKFSANIGLNYMFTNNGIEGYSFMNDGVLEQTYRNAGKKQSTHLSVWMNWNPGRTTRISVNMDGSYSDFKSEQYNTHNSGWAGNFFANVQQTLPWDLRLSLYGGGSTKSITLQGKGASYNYYGLSLSRSFLKGKRLNVSINGSNLFNKYRTYDTETVTETFRSWNYSKNHSMKYGISVSWRFGDMKTRVKETVRSIHNDDVKAGGDSNTEGGGAGVGQGGQGDKSGINGMNGMNGKNKKIGMSDKGRMNGKNTKGKKAKA